MSDDAVPAVSVRSPGTWTAPVIRAGRPPPPPRARCAAGGWGGAPSVCTGRGAGGEGGARPVPGAYGAVRRALQQWVTHLPSCRGPVSLSGGAANRTSDSSRGVRGSALAGASLTPSSSASALLARRSATLLRLRHRGRLRRHGRAGRCGRGRLPPAPLRSRRGSRAPHPHTRAKPQQRRGRRPPTRSPTRVESY